jgi:DNA-binding transcriptional LysR family regulator
LIIILLEDLNVILTVAEIRNITAVAESLDMSKDLLSEKVVPILTEFEPKSTELWLICPSRQTITPAVLLLRKHLKVKCAEVLIQLVNKGVLKKGDID